jgi:large subunit ribosomal protein L1
MAEAKKRVNSKQSTGDSNKDEKKKQVKISRKAAQSSETLAKKEKEIKEAEVIAEAAPVKEEKTEKPKTTAKAGKRSAKAVTEAEEKQAKEARKSEKASAETAEAKKPAKKPTRTKLERAGKKFREAAKQIEVGKVYALDEALDLATKTSTTKFDATVELHVNLGVDPRQADQNVRGTVTLPEGTGKTVKVAVFAEADDDKKASAAGADLIGAEKIIADLDKELTNFDVLIATPNQMAKLAKYARLLGPKGLMPNPKSGTVTTDIAKAVKESKAGRVEYRVDSAGIIHLGVGRVSFGKEKLVNNTQVVIDAIKTAKPASLKGSYVKSTHISTTMGPSIKVQIS